MTTSSIPYPEPLNADVTRRMRANRRRDTRPERELRSALHRLGLRFRKDHPIRTPQRVIRPDVVFIRLRVAVFLDGCYWHACPEHQTRPTRNEDYWSAKLVRNVARDRAVDTALADAGWHVIRIWEHEDSATAADRVRVVVANVGESGPS
ncbi:MAG: very short patch repair endonuclease [Gemmatimonadaceae bacterium]